MMPLPLFTRVCRNFLPLFLGTCTFILLPSFQSARAGPDDSFDRNAQCQWVQAASHPHWTLPTKKLPPEPQEEFLISEDVNIINGLYIRSYSRHQDGVIDYKTARQILISEYNEHWNSVVETKEFPLFYWDDDDQNGEFDMWIDQQGDGSPCDIVPYQMYETGQTPMSIRLK